MAIASDGKVHMIRCDVCGVQDGHVSRHVQDFIDAMKRLKWRFYATDDGTFDSLCPDCLRPSETGKGIKILEGR
jgi:hypothetical protein